MKKTVQELCDCIARMDVKLSEATDRLDRIANWCDAYPIAVFTDPDWEEVKAKLGDTLLARVSAANMRHVCEGIAKIARGKAKI